MMNGKNLGKQIDAEIQDKPTTTCGHKSTPCPISLARPLRGSTDNESGVTVECQTIEEQCGDTRRGPIHENR